MQVVDLRAASQKNFDDAAELCRQKKTADEVLLEEEVSVHHMEDAAAELLCKAVQDRRAQLVQELSSLDREIVEEGVQREVKKDRHTEKIAGTRSRIAKRIQEFHEVKKAHERSDKTFSKLITHKEARQAVLAQQEEENSQMVEQNRVREQHARERSKRIQKEKEDDVAQVASILSPITGLQGATV